ncbi:MAG TPA: alpha-L-fucosidase [Sedimentisphaerales bacterium]|nr:alpha-L-fucosidase [Sedimentisphaerales bacterium]
MLKVRPLVLFGGFVVAFFAGCYAMPVNAADAEEARDYLKARPEQMQQWRDMKFGLFVHWGPVSLLGTEIGWSRGGERRGRKGTGEIPVEVYDNLYRSFYPAAFDAKEWVQIARAAGMKYLVFTTKHHDGFCMFDSALTDYKITNSPFKRDIVKEIADACHKGGLKLGFYYSQPDWHHPDYRTENHARYIKYLHGHLRELCTKYGKVDIIFFDGLGGKAEDWDSANLFRLVRQLQPDVVINNRAGLAGDYGTPEQVIGEFSRDAPWETNMTICDQWAWKTGDRLKSLKQCIQALVASIGGDGNFLFNVGPMPTGQIEPRQVDRLKEMGDWLRKYGESIYGTRGGPYKSGTWGASTYKGNRIYLHFFNWHGPRFTLPAIPRKVIGSSLLTGGSVKVRQTQDAVRVTVAEQYRQDIDTIVILELDGPGSTIEPLGVPSRSLAYNCKASSSSVYKDRPDDAPDKAFDDDSRTGWRANSNEGWLEADLGQPATVDTALILEGSSYFGAEKFELLCKVDGRWKSLAKGTKLGQPAILKFEPVTAKQFRLAASRTDRQLIVREFQLFGAGG